jgi:hypothetical protein
VRIYFHLTGAQVVVRDFEGVEVSDLHDALARARRTIKHKQLRQEDPSAAQDWAGWRLEVADAAGQVLVSLDLDSLTA